MNQLPIPHRVPSMIEREIAALRFKIQNEQLPSIPVLEAEVQRLGARAVLDPALKPDLHLAVMAVRDAETQWVSRAKDNTLLKQLETELELSMMARRAEAIARADSRLNAAINEYQHACLVAARSFRGLLNVQHQSTKTPGASSNLSHLRLHQFHIPHLHPISFGGSLGESMMSGLQQFEQPELRAVTGFEKVA